MQWYYALEGQQQGPVEEDALIALIRNGTLSSDDLVWNSTFGNQWVKVGTVPVLLPPTSVAPSMGLGVLTSNRELMAQARGSLQGQWGLAVAAGLVFTILSSIFGIIPFVGPIISLVISGPLRLGWYDFCLKLSRRQPVEFGMIFTGFKRFGTSLLALVLVSIFVFLWLLPALCLFIVGILLWFPSAFAVHSLGMVHWSVGFVGITVACLVLLIPAIIAQIRYSMTFFVIADDANVGPLEAIQRSSRMMKGHVWKMFCLGWRFVGWGLLCILTCLIGFLWLSPYMMISIARFYDDIREANA